MKRILSLTLILTLLALGTACAEVPGNRLGFEILDWLSDGTDNQVISPVSLTCALAMAAQGASGETRRELLDALGVENLDGIAGLTEGLTEAGLRLANAAISAEGFVPEADYVAALAARFGAEWFYNEANLADAVNEWTQEHTDGLIEKVLDEPLSDSTALVLLNAVAMDVEWASGFVPESTVEGVFHSPGGDVAASFMKKGLEADYGERDGVQMLRLQYRDSSLALRIALPEEGGVPAVLDALREEGLAYFQFEEEPAMVNLSMPRTDISADHTLNDALQALGVKRAFTGAADFSLISAKQGLYVDAVLQKARLIFDEQGTRAAAVTGMVNAMSAYNPALTVDFNMDRPFVAVVADEISGAVAFAGVVANPSGN